MYCGISQSEFEKAEEFDGQFSDVFTKSEYKYKCLAFAASFVKGH